MKIEKAVTVEDLRKAAHRRLPKIAWDFVEGGVHDELALDYNRAAYQRYKIAPRYLVNVAQRDQSVTLFGRKYQSPFGVAPMGIAGFFRRGADRMLASAAAEAQIPYIMSSSSNDSIETAARLAPESVWFQVYGAKDPAITADHIRRAKAASVHAVVLTVDTPIVGGRERNTRNGFARPVRITPSMVLQGILHPAWSMDYLRSGGTPMMENWAPYAQGKSADAVADLYGKQTPYPAQSWELLERVRAQWQGPLLVKGILHPEDAKRCIALGADGLILSNHGGRQFDPAPSPLDVLPAIRAAVGDKVTIGIDSGIRRGYDLLIAKALGADFGLVGRAALYGAIAGGQAGVRKALTMLRNELDHALAQSGHPVFGQIGPDELLLYERSAR